MLPTPRAMSTAAPKSDSDTATVSIDASVRLRFRRRFEPVSRAT
jgi:hypothetical protein